MYKRQVLVAAFKIEIGRIGQLVGVRASHHGHVGCTGVKPHVERVFGLLVHLDVYKRQVTGGASHTAGNVAIGAELRSLGGKGRRHREEGSKNNQ